jgi:hypothetical protein
MLPLACMRNGLVLATIVVERILTTPCDPTVPVS